MEANLQDKPVLLHLRPSLELRQPNYFTTRRRHRRAAATAVAACLDLLVMYSAQPTGADGATINPAALNSGELFIPHVIYSLVNVIAPPSSTLMLAPLPRQILTARRLLEKKNHHAICLFALRIAISFPYRIHNASRASYSLFSTHLRNADPPTVLDIFSAPPRGIKRNRSPDLVDSHRPGDDGMSAKDLV